jgi:hypothetical protein
MGQFTTESRRRRYGCSRLTAPGEEQPRNRTFASGANLLTKPYNTSSSTARTLLTRSERRGGRPQNTRRGQNMVRKYIGADNRGHLPTFGPPDRWHQHDLERGSAARDPANLGARRSEDHPALHPPRRRARRASVPIQHAPQLGPTTQSCWSSAALACRRGGTSYNVLRQSRGQTPT